MKLNICLCCALIAASSAQATPVYTVTLPNGATNTLDEAFANGYVTSSDEGETPSLAGLYGAADLRITGGGRLEINCNLKSNSFTGEVHVAAGAILRVTANGALGDKSGATFVEDGATLENECLDTTGDSKLSFSGEKLTFAGTGVGGVGALVARTSTGKKERTGIWGGTYLTMTGDALISTVAGYQDFPYNSATDNNSWLDMNGHTLTISGIANTKGKYPTNVTLRPRVKNPGHIVIKNCSASINDSSALNGSAANTLTLGDNASLELYAMNGSTKYDWTLVVSKTALYDAMSSNSGNITGLTGGRWNGPVRFEREARFSLSASAGTKDGKSYFYTNTTVFAGAITTGTSKLTFRNTKTDRPNLRLESNANSFGGGLTLADVALDLPVNGAVPSTSPMLMEAGSVKFDANAEYELPSFEARSNVVVGAGHGAWQGVKKSGSGTLTYHEGVTFPSLEISGGNFEMVSRTNVFGRFYAGLHYGYSTNYTGWSDGTNKSSNVVYNMTTIPTTTNEVVYDFGFLTNPPFSVAKNGSGTFYAGYIWNPSSENVKWRFASSCCAIAKLIINDKTIISKQSDYSVAFGDATLKPGANAFKYHIGMYGGPSRAFTPEQIKNSTTWTNGYAFAVCKTSPASTNSADFTELTDPGDGSVLRRYAEGTAEWNAAAAAWSNDVQVVDTVKTYASAPLSLGGTRWRVGTLEGRPVIAAEPDEYRMEPAFAITSLWKVNGTEIAQGKSLESEARLVFGADSKILIANAKQALRKKGRIAIAKSDVAIDGLPEAEGEDGARFQVTKSDDGKTLFVQYLPSGLVLFVQ